MIEMLYSNPGTPQGGMAFDREEHRLKEMSLLRDHTRSPRRSHTFQDYQIPTPTSFSVHTLRQQPQEVHVQPATPPTPSQTPDTPPEQQRLARPARPALGPPRRSYSVMNYEPLPHHHRPPPRGSDGLSLMDLPGELHYAIFDFLDPIDSTCLGLTNKHLYAIHRRMHGTVPLSTRRDGPNELEWAWHLHIAAKGSAVDRNPAVFVTEDGSGQAKTREEKEKEKHMLAKLRVKGQAYCRKCGVCRCELHKHIQDWMGEGMEYCSVKQKFGPVALEGSKPFCYMSMPRDPTRCGRHRVRRDKVMLK
ncbi:hypothetical protein CONLIGDRAFT_578185 [Coniochaeta ligniaria NRRL 30616]|uniref:F-box domain-containing protein n=1 Tax=Coniochaeta ligniaria NRRL 30616 TaxID=1408157 RepID=A0A1J7JHD2_9PEZI|nr:hypothetical protein CONLIGDRAFT_578185 [Coniochaeta ligniaria NRRL 30616]